MVVLLVVVITVAGHLVRRAIRCRLPADRQLLGDDRMAGEERLAAALPFADQQVGMVFGVRVAA